jgi:Lar family restriction alleviation protein
MTELRECPFCGSEALLYNAVGEYLVYCKDEDGCGASSLISSNQDKAIAAWNRRADGWISVDDHLPYEGQVVIILLSHIVHGKPAEIVSWEHAWLEGVSRWQPLPPPPGDRDD